MHVLRCTLFTSPDDRLTTVVREHDVVSFGEVLGARQPDTFLAHDVFEMPDADIRAATKQAMERMPATDTIERNMALSFFWNAQYLTTVRQGGVLMNDRPAPLTAGEIRQVLIQLALHPHYNKQTVVCVSEDGTTVTLSNGTVED